MEKRDLKYGNVVETREGIKYLYIGGNVNLIFQTDFLRLDEEDYNLRISHYQNDFTYDHRSEDFLDIMKIYKDYTCKELLWERKDPKLTKDEKAILRNLPKEYKWIARDKSDWIFLYKEKPIKLKVSWSGCMYTTLPFDHLFNFIKWEDEEPYSIEELLKEGEEK